MKPKVFFVILAALMLLPLVGCSSSVQSSAARLGVLGPNSGFTEVLPNIYDNGQGAAYIRIDSPTHNPDASVVELVYKVEAWQNFYRNKKILSIQAIYGGTSRLTNDTALYGELIFYEIVPEE